MAGFLLMQLRPVGDKRGSWRVLRSDSLHTTTYRDRTAAHLVISNYQGDAPALLLIYDHADRLEEAWKLQHQKPIQKLHLILPRPSPPCHARMSNT